jgi:hypothetical protein
VPIEIFVRADNVVEANVVYPEQSSFSRARVLEDSVWLREAFEERLREQRQLKKLDFEKETKLQTGENKRISEAGRTGSQLSRN